MVERLDDERLELLRQWGVGLASDNRDELRAAGKAILLLIHEIERLEVDVWNARATAMTPLEPEATQALATSLRERIAAATRPADL